MYYIWDGHPWFSRIAMRLLGPQGQHMKDIAQQTGASGIQRWRPQGGKDRKAAVGPFIESMLLTVVFFLEDGFCVFFCKCAIVRISAANTPQYKNRWNIWNGSITKQRQQYGYDSKKNATNYCEWRVQHINTTHTHTFRTVVCHVGTSGYLGTPKLQGRQVPVIFDVITSSYKCFRVRTWKLVGLKCQENNSILRIISYIISEQIDCWVLNYN